MLKCLAGCIDEVGACRRTSGEMEEVCVPRINRGSDCRTVERPHDSDAVGRAFIFHVLDNQHAPYCIRPLDHIADRLVDALNVPLLRLLLPLEIAEIPHIERRMDDHLGGAKIVTDIQSLMETLIHDRADIWICRVDRKRQKGGMKTKPSGMTRQAILDDACSIPPIVDHGLRGGKILNFEIALPLQQPISVHPKSFKFEGCA